MSRDIEYIIVQAGGKGSRMGRLTRNKPKALVPINNLPMLFHLFRNFPDKKFIVIADYRIDVMANYLREFAQVDYSIVDARGHSGTCAGLKQALQQVPDGERLMLIWCDLVLPFDYQLPSADGNVIGISQDFPCRWKYENGQFSEERSVDSGVAGLFVFQDKLVLEGAPEDGEFVRWLQSAGIQFSCQPLRGVNEFGLLDAWEQLPAERTRPFNRIERNGDKLLKLPVDQQGRDLARREIAWYRHLEDAQFESIPRIFSYEPLEMEYIDGGNVFEYEGLTVEAKRQILRRVVACLKGVHDLENAPTDSESYRIAYLDKTYKRLEKVRFLVPFANDPMVSINGRACRNVFYHQEYIGNLVMRYLPEGFRLIHGDCTFSNMLLKNGAVPVLIDPRGYFGNTQLYGDPAYDWVKLYYSIVSNYDQFNLKRFDLYINESANERSFAGESGTVAVPGASVVLMIRSSGWECMEDDFFALVGDEVSREQMILFLAITWLSLTTYAWEDYDSICGAFYNGLYYLEEALTIIEKQEQRRLG